MMSERSVSIPLDISVEMASSLEQSGRKRPIRASRTEHMAHPLDDTDRSILRTLRRHPRASITEIARRAGFARGTVYGRLERLERDGVITGWGPELDTAPLATTCWPSLAPDRPGRSRRNNHGVGGDRRGPRNPHHHRGRRPAVQGHRSVQRSPSRHRARRDRPSPVRHSQTQLALHTSHRRGLVDLF